jgi:histidine triad (HIT) family protein
MASDPSCIFCRIISGQIPSSKVFETSSVLAFLDINPIAPGHLLVVPKDHAPTIAESSSEVMAVVGSELPRLARAVLQATKAPGLNIVQNNGREAGQVVGHVHFHLIPRSPGDSIRQHWPQGKYEGDALESMRAAIQRAL